MPDIGEGGEKDWKKNGFIKLSGLTAEEYRELAAEAAAEVTGEITGEGEDVEE
jgi:hypothetical protein